MHCWRATRESASVCEPCSSPTCPHAQPQSAPAELAAEKTQTTKRRARSSITRRKAKKVKENVFSSDKDMTELRAHRIGEASAILDVVQPSIDSLPWESVYAEDGCVVRGLAYSEKINPRPEKLNPRTKSYGVHMQMFKIVI